MHLKHFIMVIFLIQPREKPQNEKKTTLGWIQANTVGYLHGIVPLCVSPAIDENWAPQYLEDMTSELPTIPTNSLLQLVSIKAVVHTPGTQLFTIVV